MNSENKKKFNEYFLILIAAYYETHGSIIKTIVRKYCFAGINSL